MNAMGKEIIIVTIRHSYAKSWLIKSKFEGDLDVNPLIYHSPSFIPLSNKNQLVVID